MGDVETLAQARAARASRARERAVARNFGRPDREARYIERRLHEYEARRGPVSAEKRQLLIAYWSRNFRRRTTAVERVAAPRPVRGGGPLVQTFDGVSDALRPHADDWMTGVLGMTMIGGALVFLPAWATAGVVVLVVLIAVVGSAVARVLDSTVPSSEVGQRAIQWWVSRDLPKPEGFTDAAWAKLEDDLCPHATMWREQFLAGEITAEELDTRLDHSLLAPLRVEGGGDEHRRKVCEQAGAHLLTMGSERCVSCGLTPDHPDW